MALRKLPTMEEKTADLPVKKPPRNRTELSITNGFEFGLGFWLAGILVLMFGVPAITCVVVLGLSLVGFRG